MELPTVFDNTLADWLTAAGVVAALLASIWLVRRVVVRRLGRIAARTSTDLDDFVVDVVGRTRLWLLLFPALALGGLGLSLPAAVSRLLLVSTTIAVFLQIGIWGGGLVDYLIGRARRAESPPTPTTLAALGFAGRVVLWSLVLVIGLDNLGVNVTALVAGLGVGGVAIGLATQNILSDLFSSLSIVIDKPFVVGDAIAVGELVGTVEHIGLKTTRLRSVNGEQLVLANGDLLQSRIRNFKRMTERRVVQQLGVVYQTPAAQVAAIPGILRELIEGVPGVRFDRAHFRAFGPSSLDFELVYWVESPDYLPFMDAQQALNLAVLRRFQAEGIEFAYPTQTVYLADDAESPQRFGSVVSGPGCRDTRGAGGAPSPTSRVGEGVGG